MKIALICTEKLPVPPLAGGAVQLYIDGILPYLSSRHMITVFSIQYPGLPDEEIKDNVTYLRVPGKTESIYLKNIQSKLDDTYDLVHVFNRPRFVLALKTVLPDTKFSLSVHNEMFLPDKISQTDGETCINSVEFINTVSRFIANGIKQRFPAAEDKLRVVYSGANVQEYKTVWSQEGMANKTRLKEKYGLTDHKIVLFVGRLSSKKGVHILLKAMKKVMDSDPKVALVIVGSKWYGKNEIDDYIRSLFAYSQTLPGPIIFTGFVPPSEVPQFFNFGDLFICASQWNEPLARVHYEAMAAGLPIITTDRGGNGEVVEGYGNGIIVEKYNDPDCFADCIESLLNDPDKLLDMGRRGRMLAEVTFNWERVAGEIFAPFESGLEDRI